MTRHAHLDPSPFFLAGGPTGALMIHGFTSSPPEMRLVGDYLHQRGLTVSGPLLPGHGTTVEDMNRCRWSDWTAHAGQALAELRDRCETVFVGGQSMGSLISLYLAAHHPDLRGAVLYSPALKVGNPLIHLAPILKHLVPDKPKSGRSDSVDPETHRRLWSYEAYPSFAAHELLKLTREVYRLLPRVTCPLLIIHSTRDRHIHPQSAQLTHERAGSADKELVTLHDSGHCLTVDGEWEFVARKTDEFIQG
jgi:carboxylesterase